MIIEVNQSDDLATIEGIISGKVFNLKDNGFTIVNDKFLMTLKNVAGNWKIHKLMWSKNE